MALGCPGPGQLLVWEWQSETYVMKQQGHGGAMQCLAYSPDGALVATGGTDAKVKLWNTSSNFCFVTFAEHEAAVTGLAFTPSGKVVVSSSLDGTVRAFDMARYRNFKTLATPRPVQLGCVAVDSSGDLVAAGGTDVFEVYLWSLTTGRCRPPPRLVPPPPQADGGAGRPRGPRGRPRLLPRRRLLQPRHRVLGRQPQVWHRLRWPVIGRLCRQKKDGRPCSP